MKRKELIQLAREAGLDIPDDDPPYNLEFNLEELGVFANLVAEKQQSWIASLEQHAKDADRLYAELETELEAAQAQLSGNSEQLVKVLEDIRQTLREIPSDRVADECEINAAIVKINEVLK